ncbi:ATP-binding protein [Rhodopirellula europaea]|nr:AAA family ATPase [Rhodopirellula europaea]
MQMSQGEKEHLTFSLNHAFRPATPINRKDLFQGRSSQVASVLDAINQNGRHLVVYGERGVGKTSLANMIALNLTNPLTDVMAPHINCTSIKTYSELWEAILSEIQFISEQREVDLPIAFQNWTQRRQDQVYSPIQQHDARMAMSALTDEMTVVLIFDEFDSLEDLDAKLGMAETIKLFSDRNVGCTIVLVGVANDIETLIEGHKSVERCLSQVKMPRMSRDEVEEIVVTTLALPDIEMTIEDAALHEISRIAKGLPNFAHQIGQKSAIEAITEGSRHIGLPHVQGGISSALDSTQGSIHAAYQRAITSTKASLYKEVLLACSLAECDEFGCFAPKDVRSPLSRILKKEAKIEAFARHLHSFCESSRGPMLLKLDLPGRARFRFANPLLEPFILLKGLNDGTLTAEVLAATRNKKDKQRRMF